MLLMRGVADTVQCRASASPARRHRRGKDQPTWGPSVLVDATAPPGGLELRTLRAAPRSLGSDDQRRSPRSRAVQRWSYASSRDRSQQYWMTLRPPSATKIRRPDPPMSARPGTRSSAMGALVSFCPRLRRTAQQVCRIDKTDTASGATALVGTGLGDRFGLRTGPAAGLGPSQVCAELHLPGGGVCVSHIRRARSSGDGRDVHQARTGLAAQRAVHELALPPRDLQLQARSSAAAGALRASTAGFGLLR